MKSNFFKRGDYRKHGKIISKPSTMLYIKGTGYDPADGPNRNQRRTEHHFRGIRMNSRGYPIGFNAMTWQDRCDSLAAEQVSSDASKGVSFKAPDKTKRTARPQDFIFKGMPNTKVLRKMARKYGAQKVARAMNGLDRGQRKYTSYGMKGNYTREGFKLTAPKGSK